MCNPAGGKQGAHDGEKLSRRSVWNEIVVMVAQKTNRLKPLNYTLEMVLRVYDSHFNFFKKTECAREARCGCMAGRMAKKMGVIPTAP